MSLPGIPILGYTHAGHISRYRISRYATALCPTFRVLETVALNTVAELLGGAAESLVR